jgi:NAD(P)-dependent dehydrogenase (short-subunit alcohol dehydrogenase family)
MGRLDGKVAVITGGAGGIGRATGRLFVAEGASVVLVDRDEAALAAAVAAIGGDRVSAAVADVTEVEATRAYLQAAVSRYGGLDILFANAGVEGPVASLTEYPDDAFDAVLAVNLRAVWLGVKYAMVEMRRQGRGGSIVITSSVAGVLGSTLLPAYAISKHAVIGLMRCAALTGAADRIRVNTVNPAPIETRMMRSLEAQVNPTDPAAAKAQREARIPLGRYGRPEEVANLVLFLASDESSYCTGGVYMIDGALVIT